MPISKPTWRATAKQSSAHRLQRISQHQLLRSQMSVKIIDLTPLSGDDVLKSSFQGLDLAATDEVVMCIKDAGIDDTGGIIEWLGRVYDAVSECSPRLSAVPLFESLGWTPECAAQLADRLRANRQAESNSSTQPGGNPPDMPNAGLPESSTRRTAGSRRFRKVALGGTFDRLHAGHRLLLAASGYVTVELVYVGITADELLASKKNRNLIQSYSQRASIALDFLRMVNPNIVVKSSALRDSREPTQAELDPDMEAIVVSVETVAGAQQINKNRKARGYSQLEVVVVGLVGLDGAGQKLSSTSLRAQDAVKRD